MYRVLACVAVVSIAFAGAATAQSLSVIHAPGLPTPAASAPISLTVRYAPSVIADERPLTLLIGEVESAPALVADIHVTGASQRASTPNVPGVNGSLVIVTGRGREPLAGER
jgi:hypothetical protein